MNDVNLAILDPASLSTKTYLVLETTVKKVRGF
jgi:hypothetical protein